MPSELLTWRGATSTPAISTGNPSMVRKCCTRAICRYFVTWSVLPSRPTSSNLFSLVRRATISKTSHYSLLLTSSNVTLQPQLFLPAPTVSMSELGRTVSRSKHAGAPWTLLLASPLLRAHRVRNYLSILCTTYLILLFR